jgi:diadenosine tetraphosphatase ApaH/serine/threonine PP2A family protein phosphatase
LHHERIMLISLLADIHANREALTACLAHAQSVGAERYVFLGDLVGYGADPGWVVDTVAGYCAKGALCVRGNHDEAVLSEPRDTMREDARVVVAWTRAHLSADQRAFLGALPYQAELDGLLFVHANAWAPQRWEYIQSPFDARSSMAATQCRLTFCGHMHEPQLYHMGTDWRASAFTPTPGVAIPLGAQRRWLCIPGSVGQPRDGSPAACAALFDTDTRRLTFHRIPYDVAAAAAKIRSAGLPENLGTRLELGR